MADHSAVLSGVPLGNRSPLTARLPPSGVQRPSHTDHQGGGSNSSQRLTAEEAGTADDDELLTVAEVAKLTQLAPQQLDSLRTRGHGPPWTRAAEGLRYRRSDVTTWLETVLRAREAREQARRRSKGTPGERLADTDDEERVAWLRLPLEDRLAVVRTRLARWHATLADQCPGEHKYVDHQDSRPPWCDACGFIDSGLHRSEYGSGHSGLRSDED